MPPTTFAQTLDAAIAQQPLTLERISARLKTAGTPVSVATLSYWKTGRSLPTRVRSRLVLAELDHILSLEPGTLAASLESCRPLTGQEVLPAGRAKELLAQLHLDLKPVWTRISTKDHLTIDADGMEVRQRCHQVLRAEVDGAQHWPILVQQDNGAPGSVATLRAVSGFDIARSRTVPEDHLTAAAASLPFPVRRGTLVAIEFEAEWGPQVAPSYRLERCFPGSLSNIVLGVEFARPPRRVRRYHQERRAGAERVYHDDVVRHDAYAQTVQLDAPSGLHGLTWEW